MEENEETPSPVRRTRSRKVVKTPVAKSPKAKPATRRTRKKVVLMEVEVSDDEEETTQDVDGSEEEKLVEKTEDSTVGKKSEETEPKTKSVEGKLEVNGSENNGDGAVPDSTEDPDIVVFNDVEMLEGLDDSNSRDQDDKDSITESNIQKASDEKMEVEPTPSVVKTKKPESEKNVIEAEVTNEGKKVLATTGTKKTETPVKEKISKPVKDDKIEKASTVGKPVESPVVLAGKKEQETKMEVDEVIEDKISGQKTEQETGSKALATKQIKKDDEKAITKVESIAKVEDKPVAKVEEKPVAKVEKPVAKVEKPVAKVEGKLLAKVEEKSSAKAEEKEKSAAKVEEKSVAKVEEKSVSKGEEKSVAKVEGKPVAKVEEKSVAKVEEKPVAKVEEKSIPKVESITKVKETTAVEVGEKTVPKVEDKTVTNVEDKIVAKVEDKTDTKVKEDPLTKVEEKMVTEVAEKQGKGDEKLVPKVEEKQITQDVEMTPSSDEKKQETGTEPKVEEKEKETKESIIDKVEKDDKPGDTDAENISEDELPVVQAVKVPEAEEVSDEELPGPKRAELPADTEVVSEDELPTVKAETKKEGTKRKLDATDYDPGSPTSENEAPAKKPSLDAAADKEKDEKPKPKKLPELDKYWKAVNDDPSDFTGWTYLLQYVDQENDMEAAREAYDAFLSHYPYCYGYWRKYADYEKRKGNKKKCEEVFERGLKAIPLSVDLWIHYLTYVKTTRTEDEEFIRSQFERALTACGLEFRSDRLWESYIKWETEGKRLRKVTAIYDRLLATPTQSYTSHFDSFQEHIASSPPNKVIEVDEFLALRKEVRHMLKHDVTTDTAADNSDAPPGDDDLTKVVSSDEETKSIRERIVSIRRKAHKGTVNAVTARWNYEEGIKRPYFHVKPLERCQLKNWQDYLDYETEQGDQARIIVLFERCLIACALYEEFWLKFVHYLESLKDAELHSKIRDVYERACTIHHLKKPSLHLQWAMFEESVDNSNRAAEILVNLEKSVPNILQIAYRRINLERRRSDHEKCAQLYEHYITNSKNKMISSNIAIKYSRFCFKIMKDIDKAQEVLKGAIAKDPNNPRLYLQLIDLTLQKANVTDAEVIEIIDSFLNKETTDVDQKVLFSQRKLEYVEDFGADVQSVQVAYEQYQKWLKQSKDSSKKKETKIEAAPSSSKKEKSAAPSSSATNTYSNYGTYGTASSAQPSYPYSGSQQGQNYYPQYGQGDQQYQYQNWQYPQGGYGGYNQWGGYSGGYGY